MSKTVEASLCGILQTLLPFWAAREVSGLCRERTLSHPLHPSRSRAARREVGLPPVVFSDLAKTNVGSEWRKPLTSIS